MATDNRIRGITGWTKGNVPVYRNASATMSIPGVVLGNFGVAKLDRRFRPWTIQHIPSGLRLTSCRTRRKAMEIVEALRDAFDLSVIDRAADFDLRNTPGRVGDTEILQQIRRMVRRLED